MDQLSKNLKDLLDDQKEEIPFADDENKTQLELDEQEDQFPGNRFPRRGRKPALMERRQAGNALFITIPSPDQ